MVFFIPARRPASDPAPPSTNPTAGYATDIATTSANSGAITAALKTPTADIRYAHRSPEPPKISPKPCASRVLWCATNAPSVAVPSLRNAQVATENNRVAFVRRVASC